jgi:allantoinase
MRFDTLIRGGECVLAREVVRADVGITGGRITTMGPELAGDAKDEIDARGHYVLPGLVDVHVHFNEPGRTEWEGAATGSAALAAGGGTCFCDMPLNSSPPTFDGRSFDVKRAALEASSLVDFGLWGGLGPRNHAALEELAERGVIGFKAFLCASGIDDFPHVNDDELGRGMEIAARLGLPVAVHAEDESIVRRLTEQAIAAENTSVRDYLASRPVQAEISAIQRAIGLAGQTGCSLHVVHVSSAPGVRAVVEGHARGIDVTCETCPHYLVLTDNDVEWIGAAAKCAPPIRDAAEREALWAALEFGKISLVASDHSPSPWLMKESPDFFKVWGGIAGCQTTLGLLLAEGHARRGIAVQQLVAVISLAPAERFRLPGKGRIEVGADADLAIVDLSKTKPLVANDLHYRHRVSPFIGRSLAGEVRRTMVRGRTVFLDGRIVASNARGGFVRPVQPAASRSGR